MDYSLLIGFEMEQNKSYHTIHSILSVLTMIMFYVLGEIKLTKVLTMQSPSPVPACLRKTRDSDLVRRRDIVRYNRK